MKYRMDAACQACPFTETVEGAHLRNSLMPGRWDGILNDLRRGRHFTCHKHGRETGDGSNLICAGSIDWQAAHGFGQSDALQIMERLTTFVMEDSDGTATTIGTSAAV